jgi:hypothetical protein
VGGRTDGRDGKRAPRKRENTSRKSESEDKEITGGWPLEEENMCGVQAEKAVVYLYMLTSLERETKYI